MVGRKKRHSIEGECCNTDLCNRHIPSHSHPRKRQFSIILDTTTDNAPNQTTTALTLPMLNATTATIVQNTSEPLSTVDSNTTTETITNIPTAAKPTTTQPPPTTVPTTVPTTTTTTVPTTTTTLPPTTPAPSIELMSFI